MLKDRNNRPYAGPNIGKVETISPDLKVRLGDVILLDSDDLILAYGITGKLLVGDEVILMPSGDGQVFFLMDKVVRL